MKGIHGVRSSIATAATQFGNWVKDKLATLKSKVVYIAKRIFQPIDLHEVRCSIKGVKGNQTRSFSNMEVFYQPGRDLTPDEIKTIDSVAAVIRMVAEGFDVTECTGCGSEKVEQIWLKQPKNPEYEASHAKISDSLVCDQQGRVWRCHEEDGQLVKDDRAEEAVIYARSSGGGTVGRNSGLPKGYHGPGVRKAEA